jgi:hypothetical protein
MVVESRSDGGRESWDFEIDMEISGKRRSDGEIPPVEGGGCSRYNLPPVENPRRHIAFWPAADIVTLNLREDKHCTAPALLKEPHTARTFFDYSTSRTRANIG